MVGSSRRCRARRRNACRRRRTAAAGQRRSGDVRGPRRRHHRLHLRHLPRARRQVRMVQRPGPGRLRAIERAGARDARSGTPGCGRSTASAAAASARRSVTPSASFLATHAHGDQRRPVAGHAGRQRRRHGASPRRRSRRQAGRGPRNARVSAQHVQPHAAGRRPRRPPRPDAGRRGADGQPVEGDGRDAVGVETRRPERLRADARPARSARRPTPTA